MRVGLLILGFLTTLCHASPTLQSVLVEPRLSYEQYSMPDNISTMGVMGLHGLVDFNPFFYGGVGLYGAVKGESGGYYALTLEGGFQHPIWNRLIFDSGLRVGGAGGSNIPAGGGALIEPYAGLKYDFGLFRTGAYYSYINFLSGQIKSQQLGVELTIPFTFNYVIADDLDPCWHFSDLHFPGVHYLGSTQNYIAGLFRTYLPGGGSTTVTGLPMESHFEFVGFEAAHYFNDRVYAFFNFAGAFHGHQNGYADELLGLGYRLPLGNMPLDAVFKIGAGSGGGGAVDTGGGFIYEPMVGLEYHLTPKLGLEINTGYVQAPGGHFQGQEISVLMKYYLSDATLVQDSTEQTDDEQGKNACLEPWRVRILNQTYLKPRTVTGNINPTMQLLDVDLDYFMTRYFYLTGQTSFAYVGKDTGGYFSGLIGLGGQTLPLWNKSIRAFAEILGGTAGGAGLDIGQGALIEPVLGINYQLSNAWALQASAGELIALQGQFRSTTVNAGVAYRFWSIT
jgi:hypothetical protein